VSQPFSQSFHVSLNCSIQRERKQRLAYGDSHVLLSIYQKTDWIGVDWPAGREMPEWFTRASVKRKEYAFVASAKDQTASR
jgi:hypothetical protein